MELVVFGRGQWSNVLFPTGAGEVLFTIATIATDKLTLIAYTFAKPKNPNIPNIYLDFKHCLVSSTETNVRISLSIIKCIYLSTFWWNYSC